MYRRRRRKETEETEETEETGDLKSRKINQRCRDEIESARGKSAPKAAKYERCVFWKLVCLEGGAPQRENGREKGRVEVVPTHRRREKGCGFLV